MGIIIALIFSYFSTNYFEVKTPLLSVLTSNEPEMVFIHGGTFQMGDIFNEDFGSKPVHTVTLDSFYIGKYEVTQKQWIAIMGNNPAHFIGDDLPVEQVSWDDIQVFLLKLNNQTGKKYRLPTEAEWEYAARDNGKKIRFGNGKNIADVMEINFNADAVYKMPYSKTGIYRKKTMPVGSFQPNNLGLHDMSGNVAEWCQDLYNKYSNISLSNPTGPKLGAVRLIRGGSWYSSPEFCRTNVRRNSASPYGTDAIGFRLACTPLK